VAVALEDITTTTVAEILLEIFCWVGLLSKVDLEHGSQFTSDTTKEVYSPWAGGAHLASPPNN